MVYIFTGEGKGKTSAALGMALRAVCGGMKVAWVAWYKDPSWNVSEYKMEALLGIDLYIGGKGFYFADATKIKPLKVGAAVDRVSAVDHKTAAHKTFLFAQKLIKTQNYDLVILDEVCQAVDERLIRERALEGLIKLRGKTHLVLTGRHCPSALVEIADTVSEIHKVKHAYDRGVMAVKGLDF
jgi:cob(I)alamin adenosyltransferase